jgi:hypothetical protein
VEAVPKVMESPTKNISGRVPDFRFIEKKC